MSLLGVLSVVCVHQARTHCLQRIEIECHEHCPAFFHLARNEILVGSNADVMADSSQEVRKVSSTSFKTGIRLSKKVSSKDEFCWGRSHPHLR